MKRLQKKITNGIKIKMSEEKLSVSKLAEISGIDRGNLWRMLNGGRGINLEQLEEIAAALKTDAKNFF